MSRHVVRVPSVWPLGGGALLAAALLLGPPARAAVATVSLQGRWTLDRDHSQLPDDVGFDVMGDAEGTSPQNAKPSTRMRDGGRGSAPGILMAPENEQTLKILSDVTDEAQHPWPVLVIDQSPDLVTLGDGASQTRAFHPGKTEEQRLADGGITTHAKWDKGAFVVDYDIEKDRDVRYTYSRASDGAPLDVAVSFRDHGKGDVITRRYQR